MGAGSWAKPSSKTERCQNTNSSLQEEWFILSWEKPHRLTLLTARPLQPHSGLRDYSPRCDLVLRRPGLRSLSSAVSPPMLAH